MRYTIRALAAPLAFLGTLLVGAPVFAQQITRTDWQMLDDGAIFPLAKELTSSGAVEAYVHAKVPAENDPKWKPAPDGKIINFGNSTASKLGGHKCLNAVNYTYFQTIVDVPAGASVNEFKIAFANMDDGVRISIVNSGTPRDGKVVPGSYVERGGAGTTDLRALITPGRNRIVVTQVDSCPTGNRLGKAEVVLNGHVVAAPVKPGPFIPIAHGDVHFRSADGLTFDFQAAGDFIYYQTTDGYVAVQGRQEKWEQKPSVSVIRAGAMRVGSDKIEFYALPSPTFFINGKETPLTPPRMNLPGGGHILVTVTASKTTLLVHWPDGTFVGRIIHYANKTMDVQVRRDLPQPRVGEGLIGQMDGDRSNDLRLRDGTSFPPKPTNDVIARVGESWRVRSTESLFTRAAPQSDTNAVKTQPALADLDATARAQAFDVCSKAGVNDPMALRNCTYDVAATGDKGFVESAKEFQTAVAALPKAERAHETPEVAVVQASSTAPAPAAGSTLLLLGEKLSRGSKYMMSGHYLTFQRDGNLCVYAQAGDRFVWCVNNDSTVKYQNAASAELSREGQLVLRDAQGAVLWAVPNQPQPNTVLHIRSDGTLELKTSSGTTVWASKK